MLINLEDSKEMIVKLRPCVLSWKMIFKQALADSEADEEYWNAAATSQRVIELAKTLAIDDPEQAYRMKQG